MPFRPAIASMSLGRAWVHGLRHKLSCASEAGFEGVEIFYEDLEYQAQEYGELCPENIVRAAEYTRRICDELSLTIIALQPFIFYEGLTDRNAHAVMITKLKLWFRLVKILGTDIIQVPSNFQQTGITGDRDLIVQDLTEIADLGLEESPPVRFAYESMAWGTYIDTWDDMWEVVTRVDRPNFGTVLDAFHIAGRVWADPTALSGKTKNADADLEDSLQRLVDTVDIKKLFYLQVADAERMVPPITNEHPFHIDGQPPRMSWSRNARLFPYESEMGAYLPIVQVTRAFLKTKYEGWVSMELFSRTLSDPDSSTPESHAKRGIKSWNRLADELSLH